MSNINSVSASTVLHVRGDVVPIIARRSWHVIAAMLGVLKAGGAYMPVAPNYPMERIKDVVIGAGAKLCVAPLPSRHGTPPLGNPH